MFVVIGLNHKTPLHYREKIAINAGNIANCICQLQQFPDVEAVTLLSTCNRIEIYALCQSPQNILQWLEHQHLTIWPELQPFIYIHHDEQALMHTMRVATGLDSMLIGEPQILGQLKQAFHLAIELGAMNEELKTWFEFIFHISKKARHQSGINLLPISVASVAVDCILQYFPILEEKTTLLIGSGEIARLAAVHLQEHGCKKFIMTSRHLEHATHLATQFNAQAIPITELHHYLCQVDMIITASSCPLPFISQHHVHIAMNQRQHQPLLMVDLAVPRDIEANVAQISGVTLINIEHLQKIQAKNQAERLVAAEQAELILKQSLALFQNKQKSLQAQDLICDYRSYMQDLAKSEVTRAHQKLAAGHCQYQVIDELSERLLQKFIHYPTIGMQQAACEDRRDLLELVSYLFNPRRNSRVNS